MKRLKGLLLGLTSGALFAFLFAPTKGKELRTKLKKEWDAGGTGFATLKKNLKLMATDFIDSLQYLTESPQVQNALDKGKEKFYEVTGLTPDDVENLADKATKQGEKLRQMSKKLKSYNLEKHLDKTVKTVKDTAKKIKKEIEKRIE